MENVRGSFINACTKAGINEPNEFIKELYLGKEMSSPEIHEYLLKKYNIQITTRSLQQRIQDMGITRSFSEAKKISIKKGRMVYYQMPEDQKYKARQIPHYIRFMVLERDNFTCKYCGKNTKEDKVKIEIHHKDRNSNNLKDLDTVCIHCHRGLHLKERKELQRKIDNREWNDV